MATSRSSLAALGVALAVAGCVTRTEEPRTGLTRAPVAAAPALPEGPIARPVEDPGATTSSKVTVEVRPLGSIPYDGQVLPLVSPDGRFIASETGSPPAWDVLLGGTTPYPMATRVEVFDLSESPIARVHPRDALPPGVILGRSCDAEGFLVEGIRVDGDRWIGKVTWGGSLEWLVQGAGVAAQASLGAGGILAYARLDSGALVIRDDEGAERSYRRTDGVLVMPTFAGDGRLLHTILVSPEGDLDLMTIRLEPRGGVLDFGEVVSRTRIAVRSAPAMAYQVLASTPGPLPGRDSPLIVYHPTFARMAVYDAGRGEFALLAEGSVGAAVAAETETPGFLLATPEGLTFQPARRSATARVLAESYIPRATTDAARPYILLGPGREPNRLEVAAMAFAPAR